MKNKALRLVSTMLVALTLSACGGGSGGSTSGDSTGSSTDSSTGGSGSTPNTPPVLSVSNSNVQMNENSTQQVTLSATDANNDTVTFSASSNNSAVSVSVSGTTLTLTSGQVNSDTTVTVTAKASDGKASDSETITVTVNDEPNTAPELDIETSISGDENQTITLQATVNDADGDNVTLSVKDSGILTVNVSGTTLTSKLPLVSTQKVETFTVVASDGKDSVEQEVTVTINDTLPDNTAPVVNAENPIAVQPSATREVTVNVTDDFDTEFELSVSSEDTSVATVSLSENGFEVTGVSIGETTVTYTAIDTQGLEGTETITVTVADNVAPEIIVIGEEEGTVSVYEEETTKLVFEITDPDDSVHDVAIKTFNEVIGSISIIDSYELTDEYVTFTMDQLPSNMDKFTVEMVLTVSDGEATTERPILINIVKRVSGAPTFVFENTNGPFIYIAQNDTTTIGYTIEDDVPENVNVQDILYWYGDQDKIEVSLDAEKQEITITTTDVEPNTSFGYHLSWKDGSINDTTAMEFFVTSPIGEDEIEMLQFQNDMYKHKAAIDEYKHLSKFYVEVAENVGLITSQQAEDYLDSAKVSDEGKYAIFTLYLRNITGLVADGSFKNQTYKSDYKIVMTNLSEEALELGKLSVSVINELSLLMGETLPQLTHSTNVYKYDEANNLVSRLKGNTTYGSYNNSVWSFDTEYKFMEAVVERAKTEAESNLNVLD